MHRRLIDEKLLREAAGYKPDAVLLGGDLAEGGVPYARIEENIKRLTALAPVMYVWEITITRSASKNCSLFYGHTK